MEFKLNFNIYIILCFVLFLGYLIIGLWVNKEKVNILSLSLLLFFLFIFIFL